MPYKYKKEPGIYIFTNKVNGKKYVGESMNIYRRMVDYRSVRPLRPFDKALIKYGINEFDLKIMYFPNMTKLELLNIEETFIFLESSLVTEHGYNVCGRGQDSTGRIVSNETRKRMSQSQKGRIFSNEHRMKLSQSSKCKIFSNEHRKKIAEANRGRTRSEETRKRMSEGQKMSGRIGDKNLLSKIVIQIDKHTNKTIEKFSNAKEVERKLKISSGNISQCCNGKRKSSGGFIWKYENN